MRESPSWRRFTKRFVNKADRYTLVLVSAENSKYVGKTFFPLRVEVFHLVVRKIMSGLFICKKEKKNVYKTTLYRYGLFDIVCLVS